MGPEFEKGDGRLRPSLQQRLPGAEGPPEGCTTDPRHAACGGPLPSSAEGPCILRMSWHQLKAWVRHRRIRARYSDFGYLLVWGYIADLSMVPRLRRGRLASRALRTPFISCAVIRPQAEKGHRMRPLCSCLWDSRGQGLVCCHTSHVGAPSQIR